MNLKAKIFLTVPAVLFFNLSICAQPTILQDDEDVQSWNDVQITVPLSKRFDFVTGFITRFGKNISRLNDGRFLIGYSWKPTKALTVSPFYMHIRARNALGRFRIEHRLHLRAAYKFPIKRFGLSHRSQFEYRLRSPRNTWRYRPSLTFEKEIPKRFVPDAKFYVTEEPFYDSATSKFSRNRFYVGIVKTLSKSLSLDIYYLRQNDGFSRPGDLNVIGTSWKVKL
ncbi:MAG: DUF2490 domain-containing protein [Saprospiraceae bacterium]|nr:DUF2490 domain-containing protein [Pyrinomonadaceae bacterium]